MRLITLVLIFLFMASSYGQSSLKDPAEFGPYSVLAYSYEPASLDPSDPLRTDVSRYFNSPDYRVSEEMDNVPLRAVGHYPEGEGTFPLVLIFHGNHHPLHPSHEGYEYLTKLLASHGMICLSIDGNFLNGGVWGEMDARAILILRHLQRWRQWNSSPEHTFYQKIDLEKIGLAGHSRGGEAITVSNVYNQTLHKENDPDYNFQFSLSGLFAIAPVDGQIGSSLKVVIKDTNYFVMHGSHDGDVYNFAGLKTYDRAFPIDKEAEGFKSLLFVHGANHNYWNTEWASHSNDVKFGIKSPLAQISAGKQQALATVFMSAFFQWTLLDTNYKGLFTKNETFPSVPLDVTTIQQYSDKDHIDINNYQEDTEKSTGTYPGSQNHMTNLSVFKDGVLKGYHTWNNTNGIIVGWNSIDASYEISLPQNFGELVTEYPYLSLRVGQIYESSPVYNPSGEKQNLAIRLELGKNKTGSIETEKFTSIIYPLEVYRRSSNISKSNMQTIRIPLKQFVAGKPAWKLEEIRKIKIHFDQTPSGLVVLDDIQLTK